MTESTSSPRGHHLLFVCTANICRSPMAEELARDYARRRDWPVEARSAGIMGLIDKPAHKRSRRAMMELRLDLSEHKSRGLSDDLVDWADHILVMELGHQVKLHQRFPRSEGKVLMLGTFGGTHEVPDPIGGWMGRYRRCRELLVRCIEGFMDQLPPPA